MEQKKNRIFYLAVMYIDFSGIWDDSLKLFKTKEGAEKYIKEMEKKHGKGGHGHDFEIFEMPLND